MLLLAAKRNNMFPFFRLKRNLLAFVTVKLSKYFTYFLCQFVEGRQRKLGECASSSYVSLSDAYTYLLMLVLWAVTPSALCR